jgi:cell wall-associated NlpC family hydrolase
MTPAQQAHEREGCAQTHGEAVQRARVEAVARSWIGTPFHDRGEVKGAGCDCATLLKCVFVEAGLIAPFEIGYYPAQFFLHSAEERYLAFVRRFGREIAPEAAQPGDVVLYKIGLCFAHGALIVSPGWPAIIHAHAASRCVRVGNGRNPHLGMRVLDAKFFSMWAKLST